MRDEQFVDNMLNIAIEEDKQAPFKLDYNKLLKLVDENITNNKQMYEQEIYGNFLENVDSCITAIKRKL